MLLPRACWRYTKVAGILPLALLLLACQQQVVQPPQAAEEIKVAPKSKPSQSTRLVEVAPSPAAAPSQPPQVTPRALLRQRTLPAPPTVVQGKVRERPVDDLVPGLSQELAQRAGALGAAYLLPVSGDLYLYGGHELFPMASVAKVLIMLAVMERAVLQERPLTSWEEDLIEPMIQISDNDATEVLWYMLGDAPGLEAFLERHDIPEVTVNSLEGWGGTKASPVAVAQSLALLLRQDFLTPDLRALALSYLHEVIPEQRWGIEMATPSEAAVALKDGWYPDEDGWWVNSVGIVGEGANARIVVVLTWLQPTLEEGIETIEFIVRALLGSRT